MVRDRVRTTLEAIHDRMPRGLLLIVTAVAASACGEAETARRPALPPIAIEAVTVEAATLRDEVELVGQLEANESVVLRPEIDGVVGSIEYTEGQTVSAGALLVRLRDEWQRAALAEAEAARVLAEQAHARARPLAGEGVLSAAELDRVTAELAAARAREELARIQFERTSIRAPFAGALGPRLVSPGDRVTRETALVQLDAVESLKLVFTLPEMAVGAVRQDVPLTVTVAPFPGEEFRGEVYFISPTLDPASRRLLVKARVENPEQRLRPGHFAQIKVEAARRENALVVPASALVQEAGGTSVWKIQPDGTGLRVPVELGLRRAGSVEIVSGLQSGDRIVSAGTHKVVPGAPLQVTAPAAPAATGSTVP
jgi:membrane fusion protein (multidrug efflux system)